MPTYAYRCTECNNYFEMRQGFDSPTQVDCPRCGKLANRQFSPVPIVFKGSGWYVNDYGSRSRSSTSSVSSTNGDSAPASDSEREDRRDKAREERGKPPVPAASSSSSSSSVSFSSASSAPSSSPSKSS